MPYSKSQSRRPWLRWTIIAAVIVIILAIAIPLAVILPRRGKSNGKLTKVILPLYIYPVQNTTWDPLYEAVKKHPRVNFLAVVNPNSGPGESQYPSADYAREVQKLNAYPNVQTIGYVRTAYATRNVSTALEEIARYAGWSSNSSSLAMHGIFFDEAPHQYSAEAVEFMSTVNRAVKDASGLQGHRTIIHNPGTIPDSRYDDGNTDITVMFEESYAVYQDRQASLAALPPGREGYSYMVHSVPAMSRDDLRKFVDQLSQAAEYLFLTNLDQKFYESFGSLWTNFTDVVHR